MQRTLKGQKNKEKDMRQGSKERMGIRCIARSGGGGGVGATWIKE